MLKRSCGLAIATIVIVLGSAYLARADELSDSIRALQAVGPKGQGNAAASRAWQNVAKSDANQLTQVLAGMDKAGTLATNWLRAAVDTIAERELKTSGKLPIADLERFLFETQHAPRGRRVAYEWIVKADPEAPKRLLPKMLDDPSLELRRDAVASVLDRAGKAKGDAAEAIYLNALGSARDLDQVKVCTEALKKLGKPIDTATHLGFVNRWRLIGPFDNVGEKGYAVAYPPEKEINLETSYEGKMGKVKWTTYKTDDAYGTVDLTKALDKHKGAIVYALHEFISPIDRQVQLRLGCINANKLWVNGKFVDANEVYHAGSKMDQYNSTVPLKKGKNTILLKICQNEQTDSWAQKWQFQLRVTDTLGGAVLSEDREVTKTALLR